ncbi:hypothetical protein ALC57_09525 [Trachymyrmex cornetzi]|uniref:Uncharacterized protein n=1 Tax=Trachymyrmex cornetzi TaxID=471704 RepID=A0A195DZ63_9HYME|nr:hypothetical protein ALC57_09525 [Trachymyrmex cornetzi]
MYLLLHNRYICYVVIVIISIIHRLNRPRKGVSRKGKTGGRTTRKCKHECALARSWCAIAPHNSRVTVRVKTFSHKGGGTPMVAAILLTRSNVTAWLESREKRASTSAEPLLPASYGFVVDNARMKSRSTFEST